MATFSQISRLISSGTQLPSSTGVIYTAPSTAGLVTQVTTIVLHNTNTSTENVALYDNGSANANRVLLVALSANETLEYSPKTPWCLNPSETIQGSTTTASKVNIQVIGRTQTA
jgi:hypothetical protein